MGVKHTQRCDRAVHNCKNIRLRECLDNNSQEEKVCGWDEGRVIFSTVIDSGCVVIRKCIFSGTGFSNTIFENNFFFDNMFIFSVILFSIS